MVTWGGEKINIRGVWVVQQKNRMNRWYSWVPFESVVLYHVKWTRVKAQRGGFSLMRSSRADVDKWCEENPDRNDVSEEETRSQSESEDSEAESSSEGENDSDSDEEPLRFA
jgi:hypothetical protein